MTVGEAALVEVLVKGDAHKGEMTSLERKAWGDFKWKSLRDALLAMTGGATLGWFAGQKFNLVNRFFVSSGFSYVSLKLASGSIVNRHSGRILSMNGTWMQQEMANSLLRWDHRDPKLMGVLSKYFYVEELYDDTSDKPKLKLRRRNVFQDRNAAFEATAGPDEHTPTSPNTQNPDPKRGPTKETNPSQKLAPMKNAVEVMENPFECIFGIPGEAEEIPSSSVPGTGRSNTTLKRHGHGSRRHRRHRRHHHEASEVE